MDLLILAAACAFGYCVYKLAVKFGLGGQPGGGSYSDGVWDTFGDE